MTQLNLSIVVPSRGDVKRLQSFLQAFENSITSITGFELILIVNGPHDQTEIKALQSKITFPIKWFYQESPHVNEARNLGLANASKDFILLLDDDCHITGPEFWKITHCLIKDSPDLAHGGCYSLPENSSWVDQAYWLISHSWLLTWGQTDSPFVVGGLILLPKKAVENQVRFNNKIAFGSSELDFADRLREAQISILFQPQWKVIHCSKISFREFLRKAIKQGKGAREAVRFKNSPLHSKQKEIESKRKELLNTFFFVKRPIFKILFYAYRKMYATGHWSSDPVSAFVLKHPLRSFAFATLGYILRIKKRSKPLGDIIPRTLFPVPPLIP
ncbi:MAG: glycosyltransferase family A protein, partial [Pseudobdellovibrionaceae bacterium]